MSNAKELPLVLVVDDEPIISETFKAIFDHHFRVLAAPTGRQALEIINNTLVNLVFLDINIPDMNGIEILCRIKERHKDIPVIMVTAAEDAEILTEARRLGIYNYITKPFDAEGIIALAQKAIEK